MQASDGQTDSAALAFPYTTVAILGGTGSLGTALTAYLLSTSPDIKLRIFSRNEHRQAAMCTQYAGERRLSFLLGDVRDASRLRLALKGCDLVLHTAAIKRIDAAEQNPYEAVRTNILGTWNVLQAAIETGVRQVVTISSDKACRAETIYGATKSVAERLTTQANTYAGSATRFAAVRYGNVAGSQSSVIPLWQQCVATGQSLPLTSAHMSRFWLSMADAVRLVCWVATQHSRGGLFIPHLPAFHVTDLARALLGKIAEAPLVEGTDIVTIGVRGIEKIHEDLGTEQEMARAFWFAPSDAVPCVYLVPPAMQHWETPVLSAGWLPPPAPCLTGPVATSEGPAGAYNSGLWPWRLSVQDLRDRLREP